MGTLHEDLCTSVIVYIWIFLRMRNVSDKSCRESQNTCFMFGNFLWKSCCLWENVKKYGTARQTTEGNITRLMPFVCWITKATDTHLIIIAFRRSTGYANAPECCIICKLPVLLTFLFILPDGWHLIRICNQHMSFCVGSKPTMCACVGIWLQLHVNIRISFGFVKHRKWAGIAQSV